ncbi:MAG: hypothetical protein ACREEM_54820, partial [Blastocatellia bacterium]
MVEQRRAQRVVVIDADGFAGDRLVAALGDRVFQSVLPVILVRALHAEIDRELGVLRQVVIHLPTVNLLDAAVIEPALEVVVEQAGVRRCDRREEVLNLDRHGIEAAGRNLVAGKGIAQDLPVDRARRRRVVDRAFQDVAPQRVFAQHATGEQLAEIAAAVGRRRDRAVAVEAVVFLVIDLGREEEESFVAPIVKLRNPDLAAEGSAEIVLANLGLRLVAFGVNRREGRRGVQRLVVQVIVDRAVEAAGPRPRGEIEQAAAHLSEFGGEVIGLDGEFLDGVERRLQFVEEARIERAGRVLPFEDDAEGAARAAIDADAVPSRDRSAGRERQKRERVAHAVVGEIERQLIDLVAVKHGAL